MSHPTFIREWVLRTVGSQGNDLKQIADSFTVDHPDQEPSLLDDLLQSREDFLIDENGRVTLTESAQEQLAQSGFDASEIAEISHLGEHEWTHRAKSAG